MLDCFVVLLDVALGEQRFRHLSGVVDGTAQIWPTVRESCKCSTRSYEVGETQPYRQS